MPPRRRRIYWDTSVFISLIDPNQDPQQQMVARGLLEDARKGLIEIVTSTFTRAEVRQDRGQPALAPEQHARVNAYFQHTFIIMVPLDRRIAELAAQYGEQLGLKPPDAVHIATAVAARVEVFQAWDDHFFRKVVLDNTPVPVERPTWTGGIQSQMPLEPER